VVRSHRSSPPRVGVDLRALVRRPTGIGIYTLALLRELSALGRFALVGLVHREPEARPELERIGVEIEIEPAPLGVLWQQLLLPRRLAAGDLDLFWSPLLTLPRRLPIPAIVTVHDLAVLHVPETLSFKVRWSLLPFLGHSIERASAVVAISEATAREIAHAWPHAAGRIVTIPNGVDPEFEPAAAEAIAATRARLGAPAGYLLYAGTIEPRKNLDLLLDAWLELRRDRGDTLPLLLAGPYGWKSRALERRIAALEGAGVRRLGRLERADLVATVQAATLFVFPSFYEGFGLPAAEAMACGVPVVAGDRSSLPEVVGDGGLLIDPEDPFALAAALGRLLDDAALRSELGRRGVERARRFSWPQGARRLADLFDATLARGGAP
jgi:glycosyltransferase involved in cell wall biosynthesis